MNSDEPVLAVTEYAERADNVHCRGLFVIFHAIEYTIFESQVLIHVEDMRRQGIELEVWVFASGNGFDSSAELKERYERRYNVTIRLFHAARAGLPLAEVFNAIVLYRAMRIYGGRFRFVHARTDYSAFICGLVRIFRRFELIWDCRGDTVEEYRMLKPPSGVLSRAVQYVRTKVVALHRAMALRLSTKCIFVSESLRERLLLASFSRPVEIIPCLAEQELFFFSPQLRWACREKLGLTRNQIVLVYAGSITYYQCFDQTVELFSNILKINPRSVLLLVTPQRRRAEEALSTFSSENFRVLSGNIDDVNGFLNAADFAIFLRERNPVNTVASPLKFAEYCMAGLPVIMTDSVTQSASIASTLGNMIKVELGCYPEELKRYSDERRARLSAQAAALLSRSAVTPKYLRLYGCNDNEH